MIKRVSKRSLCLFVVLSLSLSACTEDFNEQDYKKEAEAVCEVFNPAHWKDLPPKIEPGELQEIITIRLAAALKSPDMAEIFMTVKKSKIDKRYEYYIERVSLLIGERHECPYIQEYFKI